jgi:methionine aminopeptidase
MRWRDFRSGKEILSIQKKAEARHSNAPQSYLAIARAGERVSMIGAIQNQARRDGFSVIRELCGHGVGRAIHEPPNVPNYEDCSSPDVLTEGLVIAIEPMFAARLSRAVQRQDGWTISTHNGVARRTRNIQLSFDAALLSY